MSLRAPGRARWMPAHMALMALMALLCAAVAHAADVDIALVRMGVGNHVRPGDMTALLVRVTSGLQAPVQARIEWSVRNADGDVARYARDAALAPGAPTERWVYGVMPILSASAQGAVDLVTTVRVVEVDDGRVVRVLGERRIDGASAEDPAVPVEVNEALIGMVGDGRAGLAGISTPTPNLSSIASMNELTKVARGIAASDLPDRWEGLASFETLVWTNSPVQNLGSEQARAVLDWTRRGGNLVIVLPESGDPWGMAGQRGRTPFAPALPEKATRHDAVPVRELLPVLTKDRALRNDAARTAVWSFGEDAGNGFAPIVMAPTRASLRNGTLETDDALKGRALVVRRPFGFGFVTVVGIDVDGLDRRALVAEGLPQADVFWNRILGRRADAPTPAMWAALAAEKRLDGRGGYLITGNGGELVNAQVGLQSRAAIGVLGLLAAFALYWALAGPGSFFALRSMRRPQFAWLAFLGVASGAAALAWIATGVFALTSSRVQHLTFVDRVEWAGATAEERSMVRVQSWMGVALPGYGTARVALGKSEGAPGGDVVGTWFPPPAGNQSGFPDSETYLVAAGSQADYDIPSRATATVLTAQWVGRPLSAWDGTPREMPERRLRQDIAWGERPTIVLHGALAHSLPGPLRDVTLVHVTPFRPPERTVAAGAVPLIVPSASMPSYARMARMAQWDPGVALDVGPSLYGDDEPTPKAVPAGIRMAGRASAEATVRALWYDPVLQSALSVYDPSSVLQPPARLEMLQLYAMLQPPLYVSDGGQSTGFRGEAVRVERDLARGVDLSRWFSQPCLLVLGRLDDAGNGTVALPFPFTIDGDEPRADGQTFVRVVFPLPAPPAALVPLPAPAAK
jgi:hypothetical protein